MPKERTRPEGEPLKPPGKWSEDATIVFYERYDGNIDLMAEVIESFYHHIDCPGAFAAKIKDFVLQSVYWRSKNVDKFLADTYCAGCGKPGDDIRMTMFENRPYCDKCYVIRKYKEA